MPPVPVTVPSVGESISEGILSRWHKADGSLVRSGEPLFELETDKATSDVPAAGSGVLRIAVKEGETVAVGATVATIDPADSIRYRGRQPRNRNAAPPARQPDKKESPDTAAGTAPGSNSAATATQPLSPAVRRIVNEEDVDVSQVPATGPGGRLTKGDVLTFLESPRPSAAPVRLRDRSGHASRCRRRYRT